MTRQEEIRAKGFDMQVGRGSNEEYSPFREPDKFSRISIGVRSLENALTDVNFYAQVNPNAEKENVLRAIENNDLPTMRDLSQFFFKTSGIYARLVKYLANLYRYDWILNPVVISNTVKPNKIEEGFYKALIWLDNFNSKKVFSDIALKVVRDGCFYGYKIQQVDRVVIQELPSKYCRSRFFVNGKPVVEFNMRFFDDTFRDTEQRIRILKIFPKEFQKGYILYKEGKLAGDYMGDTQGWYLLDVNNTVKFNIGGIDYPILMPVIPSIIDLAEAQELDRQKTMQQLLRIIIQQMPLDKNGELVFDVDEAKALHNNAVSMLQDTIGVDVLTTFAEVKVEDLAERKTVTSMDELSKVERTVFNEAGVSQMQFNTNGNLALERSIANDEASIYNLILQFEDLLNEVLAPFNTAPKKLYYKVQLLPTTIYNYQKLSEIYSKQMSYGFSKMLPQIALGQSQSSILATAYFENDILNLNEVFVPPVSSATQSGKPAEKAKEGDGPGRKPLPDEEKSDKTIKNKESMS